MQQETTSTVKELVPEDKDKKEECDLGDNTSKFPTGNTDIPRVSLCIMNCVLF